MSRTKIICTIGPASRPTEKLVELINNGLSACRFNFSHGDHEEHMITVRNLAEARKITGKEIPMVLDTKGPEIRLKKFKDDATVTLTKGNKFTVTTRDVLGDETIVSVSYEGLANDLKVGTRILIDDGLVELVVDEIKDGTDCICTIKNTGKIGNNKGVNLPDVYVNLPALTDKDKADILFGIEQGFSYVAASFIRSASDVKQIRDLLNANGGEHIDIISKIESREGLDNIDEILDITEGIMVARGDLGVEIPTEEVPQAQKMLIKKANAKGKLVVTATQMLETMTYNPRPTRAEASDVANAVYDGTDCIMLSGETAKGDYPVEACATMNRIATAAEAAMDYKQVTANYFNDITTSGTNSIAYSACSSAENIKASGLFVVSESGHTCRNVARFRPEVPFFGLTSDIKTLRKLNLVWGCTPVLTDENINDAHGKGMLIADIAKNLNALNTSEDRIVMLAGTDKFRWSGIAKL